MDVFIDVQSLLALICLVPLIAYGFLNGFPKYQLNTTYYRLVKLNLKLCGLRVHLKVL